jgi:hypothetical protein
MVGANEDGHIGLAECRQRSIGMCGDRPGIYISSMGHTKPHCFASGVSAATGTAPGPSGLS